MIRPTVELDAETVVRAFVLMVEYAWQSNVLSGRIAELERLVEAIASGSQIQGNEGQKGEVLKEDSDAV